VPASVPRLDPVAAVELSVPAMFLAGVAASPHCSLMCGPLQLAQLRRQGGLSQAAWLHGGRIGGYAALGALAGAVGAQLMLWLPPLAPGNWLRIAAALLMCAIGIGLLRAPPVRCAGRACKPAGRGSTMARGIGWALVPCGLLYGALLLAMLSSSAVEGAALMLAFGLGTVPLSLGSALLLRRLSLPPPAARRGAALALLVLGGVSLLTLASAGGFAAWCRTVLV
jgi:sulfite exporter TauE/SafE